jgi:hypothetical protein
MSLKKIKEIAEGWRNVIMPPEKLKELITLTVKYRMKHCVICPHHSQNDKKSNVLRPDHYCTSCGCTLSAKTASLGSSCPLPDPKWVEVNVNIEENELHS